MNEGRDRPRLRLREAAEYLAVSPRSLADRGWRLKHGIPCFRVGKAVVFDATALDRWLARHQERRQADREAKGGAA
jgi:hypothetical protein